MEYEVVDLFCGVGGLTCGLQKAGLRVVAGFDNDKTCEYTYSHNNHTEFHCRNIREVNAGEIDACYSVGVKKILVGCAPCQPFSAMSYKRFQDSSRELDEKYDLLSEFGRLIKEVHPVIVSMENVPEIRNSNVFRSFVEILHNNGYFTDGGQVVYCPDYGIPQNRHRFVLLASKLSEIHLIKPTHNRKEVTVRPHIEYLPPVNAGEMCPSDHLHRAASLSDVNLKRIRASVPGGTWKDWPEDLRCKCHRQNSGQTYVLFVTSKNVLNIDESKPSASWGVLMEIGAAWVTQKDHWIFNIDNFKPERPLNIEDKWVAIYTITDADGNKILSLSEAMANSFCNKIIATCDACGYSAKSFGSLSNVGVEVIPTNNIFAISFFSVPPQVPAEGLFLSAG